MTMDLSTSRVNLDLNNVDAEQSEYELIPEDTIVKVKIDIKAGHHNDGYVTEGKDGHTLYINLDLVVQEGKYINRHIFDMVGRRGKKVDENGKNKWEVMGNAKIKSILASHYGISRSVESDKFKLVDYSQLVGKTCYVKVGVKEAQGDYKAKNEVKDYVQKPMIVTQEKVSDDNLTFSEEIQF